VEATLKSMQTPKIVSDPVQAAKEAVCVTFQMPSQALRGDAQVKASAIEGLTGNCERRSDSGAHQVDCYSIRLAGCVGLPRPEGTFAGHGPGCKRGENRVSIHPRWREVRD
jgi:hypothetical protein